MYGSKVTQDVGGREGRRKERRKSGINAQSEGPVVPGMSARKGGKREESSRVHRGREQVFARERERKAEKPHAGRIVYAHKEKKKERRGAAFHLTSLDYLLNVNFGNK